MNPVTHDPILRSKVSRPKNQPCLRNRKAYNLQTSTSEVKTIWRYTYKFDYYYYIIIIITITTEYDE